MQVSAWLWQKLMPARRRLRGKRPAGEPVVLQDPSDGGLLDGAELSFQRAMPDFAGVTRSLGSADKESAARAGKSEPVKRHARTAAES